MGCMPPNLALVARQCVRSEMSAVEQRLSTARRGTVALSKPCVVGMRGRGEAGQNGLGRDGAARRGTGRGGAAGWEGAYAWLVHAVSDLARV